MKYIIKTTIEGAFPGSPDHNYYRVDEKTWVQVQALVRKFERFDTYEEATGVDLKDYGTN